MLANSFGLRHFEILRNSFVQPKWHHWQHRVQHRMRRLVSQVDGDVFAVVRENHAGATLFDEQRSSHGGRGKIVFHVLLEHAPCLEPVDVDGVVGNSQAEFRG